MHRLQVVMSHVLSPPPKLEYRAVIKFFTKKGLNARNIHQELLSVYGGSSPSYATVANWHRKFGCGQESLEDDPREGRPSTALSPENIAAVEALILTDRRIKIQQIAHELGISEERVGTIIHEHLGMSKLSARWVPRMLTPFDKHRRVETSQRFIDMCEEEGDDIFSRIITTDETWIHQYDPESKQESMQWTKRGEKPPRKFKVQKSQLKIMATIFWDCEGILLIDYLPKGTTMNGQYYADLLTRLRSVVVEKRRGKVSRGVLLLQDNAPVHTSKVSRAALRETGFQEIDHPPYSPDLAPCDYFLFKNLKSDLRGKKFEGEDEIKCAVEAHFASKDKEYFLGGLSQLKDKCLKCIVLNGDYIEK